MCDYLGVFWSKFWGDDCGGVIGSEYMILGSVVVLGSVSGLAAMRDAAVDEMSEYGHSLRAVRQSYRAQPRSVAMPAHSIPAASPPAAPLPTTAGAEFLVP